MLSILSGWFYKDRMKQKKKTVENILICIQDGGRSITSVSNNILRCFELCNIIDCLVTCASGDIIKMICNRRSTFCDYSLKVVSLKGSGLRNLSWKEYQVFRENRHHHQNTRVGLRIMAMHGVFHTPSEIPKIRITTQCNLVPYIFVGWES